MAGSFGLQGALAMLAGDGGFRLAGWAAKIHGLLQKTKPERYTPSGF